MDLSDEGQRERWRTQLGELLAGRKVICGFGPLAGLGHWVPLLSTVGAQRPLLICTGRGAGPVPTDDDATIVEVELPGFESMTEELRQHDRLARNLPEHALAEIEAYDPDGTAVWFVSPFVVDTPLLGRPVLGGRPADWLALEDKIVAEDIWQAVAYPHATSRVVEVDLTALRDASAALDEGAGTVWAGDARGGFNGGGDYVRWVVTDDERRAAFAFFAPRCDLVRVMPFLEGIPCSIHGMVLPDGTAAFRPVELAIMRRADTRRFVYGGQGSHWDPPEEDRVQMRDLARRTGEHLRERIGYRGAFGIDGVMTRDGFRPTEVNTRMSGGLAGLAGGLDLELFTLLQVNLLAGRDPEVTVEELESWALTSFDTERFAKPLAVGNHVRPTDSVDIALSWDGSTLSRSTRDDTGLVLTIGPSAMGFYARIAPCTGLPPGERIGPLNVALMRFLDEEIGSDFGEVEAAPDVR